MVNDQPDAAIFFLLLKIAFKIPGISLRKFLRLVFADQECREGEILRPGLDGRNAGKHAVCERITDHSDSKFVHDSGRGEQVDDGPHLVAVF